MTGPWGVCKDLRATTADCGSIERRRQHHPPNTIPPIDNLTTHH